MEFQSFAPIGWLLLLLIAVSKSQEDSLRSALNAVDRRQKDLTQYGRFDDENIGDYGYSLDGPDDLAFLPSSDYNPDRELAKNAALDRLLLDYLEDDSYPGSRRFTPDDVKKRISSSFRERLEEDKERQLEELARNFLANEMEHERSDNIEYTDGWDKFRNPRVYTNREVRKRYYPRLGLDSAGLRKRAKYFDNDAFNEVTYPYNYNARDEYINRFGEQDNPELDYEWNRNRQYRGDRKEGVPRGYNYPKRFPVSKRSSSFNPETIHEHKRSTSKKETIVKTDPKVAKDLSNIFGAVTTIAPTTHKSQEKTTKSSKKELPKTKKPKVIKPSKAPSSKEEFIGSTNDKPLQIKKKSINWSDYFGLDLRKRSEEDIDNEWLIERYQKAVAMTEKRNAEYPLQSFKNHDQPSKKEAISDHDDTKIAEMDRKLKTMEDKILDDALKYTGAHDGSLDSDSIQEVKDSVISRLAAAYSLEKMRRALGEYKMSIAKERERLKEQHKNEDYDLSEEKRVSVPRKQAIDEEREKVPEADNAIKCAQGDEDCEETNYRAPHDVLEQVVFDDCPKVQRACSEVSTILGHHARIFETACNMHQMCLLCSNNSWFAPTRQCNVLFLTKAFELCDGKQECQKEAQSSVRYLLDVNRSLRSEPLGECELACPDKR